MRALALMKQKSPESSLTVVLLYPFIHSPFPLIPFSAGRVKLDHKGLLMTAQGEP